jgi:hypothetical protein
MVTAGANIATSIMAMEAAIAAAAAMRPSMVIMPTDPMIVATEIITAKATITEPESITVKATIAEPESITVKADIPAADIRAAADMRLAGMLAAAHTLVVESTTNNL